MSLSRFARFRYQTIIIFSVILGVFSLFFFNIIMLWGLSKVIPTIALDPFWMGFFAFLLAGLQFYGMLDPCNSKIQAYKRKVGLISDLDSNAP